MRYIDATTVERLAEFGPLMDAMEAAHRHAPPLRARSLLEPERGNGQPGESFIVQTAWEHGRAMGVKMATILPQNAERPNGLPTVQGVYQLFDGATGSPTATIDGTMLTLVKTASDSALGARLLARDDAATMLMIGAGALAPHLIAAHMTARPSLRRVLLWNRSAPRRNALVASLRKRGLPVEATGDLEAATRAADLVCAATMAQEPLIRGAWLQPGAHVDLVGGYTPAMREADDEAVRRASLFVNSRDDTVGRVGDLTQPVAAGIIAETDMLGDLYDLCGGRHPGRRSDDEITLYKNGGGAHLDLITARFVAARAGIGAAAGSTC